MELLEFFCFIRDVEDEIGFVNFIIEMEFFVEFFCFIREDVEEEICFINFTIYIELFVEFFCFSSFVISDIEN